MMANNTTTPNDKPIGQVLFDKEQLKRHIERYGLKSLHIMSCNNQSNSSTLHRWLLGGDMQVSALANVCSGVQLDLLSFFYYDGYKFQTKLENLYRFEKAGLSIEEILKERSIEPYHDPADHAPKSLEKGTKRQETDTMIASAVSRQEERTRIQQKIIGQGVSIEGIIDRISKVQAEAFHHEAQSLEALREANRKETDALLVKIGQLEAKLEAEKEKNRQLRSEIGCRSTLHAADDSKPGEI